MTELPVPAADPGAVRVRSRVLERARQVDDDDWSQWVVLIEEGSDPSTAAKLIGFGGSSAFRRADRERHGEIMERWRDDRDETDRQFVRDTLKENVERAMTAAPVLDREGKETGEYTYQGQVANRALELIGRDVGMFREQIAVELTGAKGAPLEVTVEHDFGSLLTSLEDIGLIRRGPASGLAEAALPTGQPVLPARTD